MNKVPPEERARILARALKLVKLDENSAVVDSDAVRQQLMSEFGISRQRANTAIARTAMQLRGVARHSSGTAPDASIHLGEARRAWLIQHGGIQPKICAMIDRAMRRDVACNVSGNSTSRS